MTDQEIINIAKRHMEYSVMYGFVGEPATEAVIDFTRAILAAQLAAPVLTECRHCGFRVALNEAPQGEGA